MCFRIDYTSGISSDANAWVCVCASMQECVYKEPGVSKEAIVLLRLIHLRLFAPLWYPHCVLCGLISVCAQKRMDVESLAMFRKKIPSIIVASKQIPSFTYHLKNNHEPSSTRGECEHRRLWESGFLEKPGKHSTETGRRRKERD